MLNDEALKSQLAGGSRRDAYLHSGNASGTGRRYTAEMPRERKVDYLLNQRGMFSYTGFLSAAQVDRLREEFGVYLIASGRMCVAGLNSRQMYNVWQRRLPW
ncbi:aminotransferase class I/II-fold pyridoxal phosphate-dependent enzyme [Escherichia coli]|nr:aminotransferase class I/II-fold pyridoxal phosphate-dependent enzyme [Escherichia coli]